MSIKVHYAWRWSKELDMMETLRKVEEIMLRQIEERLCKVVCRCKLETNHTARSEELANVSRLAQFGYISPYRGAGMTCAFFIRGYGDYFYTMPMDDTWKFDAVDDVEGVENYSFWDNSDQDPNVPDDEWDARRHFWGEVWSGNDPCLTLDVVPRTGAVHMLANYLTPEFYSMPKDVMGDEEKRNKWLYDYFHQYDEKEEECQTTKEGKSP